MTQSLAPEALEALAAEIGESVYIDVARWHLYLREAHLHTVLASRLAPIVQSGSIDEQEVLAILSDVSVQLGGGKRELPLSELLPMQCQVNLIDLLEDFQRRL